MKIAIPCENNQVFQHFGHAPEFAVFETDGVSITSESRLDCGGAGHCALVNIVAKENVDTIICGGIGGGAINALASAGIRVIGGAEGNARDIVEQFINGTMKTRPDFKCSHHHDGAEHSCHNGEGGHDCEGSCKQ